MQYHVLVVRCAVVAHLTDVRHRERVVDPLQVRLENGLGLEGVVADLTVVLVDRRVVPVKVGLEIRSRLEPFKAVLAEEMAVFHGLPGDVKVALNVFHVQNVIG